MPEDTNKLDSFIKQIMDDARSESASILAAVDTDRGKAMEDAEREYRAEAERFVQSETARARAESGRAMSKKLLDDKRYLFQYRQKLSGELTEIVKGRLEAFAHTAEYSGQLVRLLQKALGLFGNAPMTVYLRQSDMPLAEELFRAFPDAALSFVEGNIELGGLICACPKRRLSADLTFDARLADISSRYSELFELQ
jgi:vacuolar-type H+-ATPase subunit E/Vma4